MSGSIYNIDFGLAAERLSPPDKRKQAYLSWFRVLLFPLQWLRNFIFINYAEGNTSLYDHEETYVAGSIVKYNRLVYTNISTTPVTGIRPGEANASQVWLLLLETDIGLRERLRYNGQTIVLQAILNKIITGDPEPSPRITIDNVSSDRLEVYFFNKSDTSNFNKTPRFYLKESPPSYEVYLSMKEEYSLGIDFRVNVPTLYYRKEGEINQENLVLLTAYIEKYKLVGTQYQIVED